MKHSRLASCEEAIVAIAVWLSVLTAFWPLRTSRHNTGGQGTVIPRPL